MESISTPQSAIEIQYLRMQRWCDRFYASNEMSLPEQEDFLLVAVQNIYFLKDFVLQESLTLSFQKEIRRELDRVFKSGEDKALSMIRDLCNSSKHQRLYSNRRKNISIEQQNGILLINDGKDTIEASLLLSCGTDFWKKFLTQTQLLIKDRS